MKTKDEIRDWLIENATNEDGNIHLSGIDFGDRIVAIRNIKARVIYNDYQQAEVIYNDYQQAEVIYNDYQEAKEIYNDEQVIKNKYEDMSKDELIARIKELENEINF